MHVLVKVYLNEGNGRGFDFNSEFNDDPRLRLAAAFTERLVTTSADLLDSIFEQLNVGGALVKATPWCEAYRAERNRSLSVGDVVMIEHRPYSVDDVGWTPVDAAKFTEAVAAFNAKGRYSRG